MTTDTKPVHPCKVRGRIVEMEVRRRFVAIGGDALRGSPYTVMEVDGVGICVTHPAGNIPTPEEVRRHLIGIGTDRVFIEVIPDPNWGPEDPERVAINTFFREYPEARTGTRAVAMELVTRPGSDLLAYPYCERMHRSPVDGDLICGEPLEDSPINGEWGGCVLANCDPPPDCPIVQWREKEAARKERGEKITKLARELSELV